MNTIATDHCRQHYRRAMLTIIIVFITCMIYGAIRYNVLKGVSWHEFPLWTMNKVFAMTAMLLAALAATSGLGKNRVIVYSVQLWHAVLLTSCIHAGMSTLLLGPERYPWFYLSIAQNATSLHGFYALSFALSILALTLLLLHRGRRLTFTISFCALLLITIHIAILGIVFWFNMFTWPAGLPPVSLVAVVAGVIALIAMLAGRFIKGS